MVEASAPSVSTGTSCGKPMKRTQTIAKIIALTLLILCVSGCADFRADLSFTRASSLPLNQKLNGPPEFQQGFKDGCETGYGAWGNIFAHTFYGWKQDPILAQNPAYQQIWIDAYSYCRIYAEQVDEHGWGNFR